MARDAGSLFCTCYIIFTILVITSAGNWKSNSERATKDVRGTRIDAYEQSVNEWNRKGENFRSTMSKSMLGANATFHIKGGLNGDVMPLMFKKVTDPNLLIPKLKDDRDDFPTYNTGFLLEADVFQWPTAGNMPVGTLHFELQGSLSPDTAPVERVIKINLARCSYRKGNYCSGSTKKNCRNKQKGGKNNRKDIIYQYAMMQYLSAVTLTVNTDSAGHMQTSPVYFDRSECGFDHLKLNYRSDGTEDDKRFEDWGEAGKWCEKQLPLGPLASMNERAIWPSPPPIVKVYLRSADDPYTKALNATECTTDFGKSAAEHGEWVTVYRTLFFCSLAGWSVFFLICCGALAPLFCEGCTDGWKEKERLPDWWDEDPPPASGTNPEDAPPAYPWDAPPASGTNPEDAPPASGTNPEDAPPASGTDHNYVPFAMDAYKPPESVLFPSSDSSSPSHLHFSMNAVGQPNSANPTAIPKLAPPPADPIVQNGNTDGTPSADQNADNSAETKTTLQKLRSGELVISAVYKLGKSAGKGSFKRAHAYHLTKPPGADKTGTALPTNPSDRL